MSTKVYIVQTWSKDGALTNTYEATIASAKELAELRKFLSTHHALVHIAPKPAKRSR